MAKLDLSLHKEKLRKIIYDISKTLQHKKHAKLLNND